MFLVWSSIKPMLSADKRFLATFVGNRMKKPATKSLSIIQQRKEMKYLL